MSFKPGQIVRLRRSPLIGNAAGGQYKIVRQLPDSGSETQYRIKSMQEPHERVAKASDLEKE